MSLAHFLIGLGGGISIGAGFAVATERDPAWRAAAWKTLATGLAILAIGKVL